MKILIDIPEETYEYWKTHHIEAGEYVLTDAVRNGVVIQDDDIPLIPQEKLNKREVSIAEFNKRIGEKTRENEKRAAKSVEYAKHRL